MVESFSLNLRRKASVASAPTVCVETENNWAAARWRPRGRAVVKADALLKNNKLKTALVNLMVTNATSIGNNGS